MKDVLRSTDDNHETSLIVQDVLEVTEGNEIITAVDSDSLLPVNETNNSSDTETDLLRRYIREINTFELLDKETEQKLAHDYINNNNQDAANRLIRSYLRLVVKIAFDYRRYGLPMMDVISEGNLGLLRAVKGFKPELGFRLSTYAMWWIKANIQDFVLRSWSMVKIGTTSMQRKLFFNFQRIKAKLGMHDVKRLDEKQIQLIQSYTGATSNEIRDMELRLMNGDESIDALTLSGNPLVDNMPSDSQDPAQIFEEKENTDLLQRSIQTALEKLSPREQKIITVRILSDEKQMTLEALGLEFNISPERVRQITVNVLQKLKKQINEDKDS